MKAIFQKVVGVGLGVGLPYKLILACHHTKDSKTEVKRARCGPCETKAAADHKAGVAKRQAEIEAIKNGTWGAK